MSREISIDKVMRDPRLLGSQLGDLATWSTWLAILKAAFMLPLTPEELEVFNAIAGGRPLPRKRLRELWVIAGRRSGKSRMAALLACYFALFAGLDALSREKSRASNRPLVSGTNSPHATQAASRTIRSK